MWKYNRQSKKWYKQVDSLDIDRFNFEKQELEKIKYYGKCLNGSTYIYTTDLDNIYDGLSFIDSNENYYANSVYEISGATFSNPINSTTRNQYNKYLDEYGFSIKNLFTPNRLINDSIKNFVYVDLATTEAINILSNNKNLTIDGVIVKNGHRILIKDQVTTVVLPNTTDPEVYFSTSLNYPNYKVVGRDANTVTYTYFSESNGIYVYNNGLLSRESDIDDHSSSNKYSVGIKLGNINRDKEFQLSRLRNGYYPTVNSNDSIEFVNNHNWVLRHKVEYQNLFELRYRDGIYHTSYTILDGNRSIPSRKLFVGQFGVILNEQDGFLNIINNKYKDELYSISHTSNNYWICGDLGTLLKMNAYDFTIERIDLGITTKLKSISFFDDLHGFVVGDFNTIYWTNDGGFNWNKIYVDEFSDYNFNKVIIPKLNIVYIVGNLGSILELTLSNGSWDIRKISTYKYLDYDDEYKLIDNINDVVYTQFNNWSLSYSDTTTETISTTKEVLFVVGDNGLIMIYSLNGFSSQWDSIWLKLIDSDGRDINVGNIKSANYVSDRFIINTSTGIYEIILNNFPEISSTSNQSICLPGSCVIISNNLNEFNLSINSILYVTDSRLYFIGDNSYLKYTNMTSGGVFLTYNLNEIDSTYDDDKQSKLLFLDYDMASKLSFYTNDNKYRLPNDISFSNIITNTISNIYTSFKIESLSNEYNWLSYYKDINKEFQYNSSSFLNSNKVEFSTNFIGLNYTYSISVTQSTNNLIDIGDLLPTYFYGTQSGYVPINAPGTDIYSLYLYNDMMILNASVSGTLGDIFRLESDVISDNFMVNNIQTFSGSTYYYFYTNFNQNIITNLINTTGSVTFKNLNRYTLDESNPNYTDFANNFALHPIHNGYEFNYSTQSFSDVVDVDIYYNSQFNYSGGGWPLVATTSTGTATFSLAINNTLVYESATSSPAITMTSSLLSLTPGNFYTISFDIVNYEVPSQTLDLYINVGSNQVLPFDSSSITHPLAGFYPPINGTASYVLYMEAIGGTSVSITADNNTYGGKIAIDNFIVSPYFDSITYSGYSEDISLKALYNNKTAYYNMQTKLSYYDKFYTILNLPFYGNNGDTLFSDDYSHDVVTHGGVVLSTSTYSSSPTSALFDGVSGYLSITYSSEFDLSESDFSIKASFNLNSLVNPQVIICNDDNTFTTESWCITVDPVLNLISFFANDYLEDMTVSVPAFVSGVFYTVEVLRKNGVNYLYLDGILYASSTFTIGNTSTYNVTIGYSNILSLYFDGYIDDVSISVATLNTKYMKYSNSFLNFGYTPQYTLESYLNNINSSVFSGKIFDSMPKLSNIPCGNNTVNLSGNSNGYNLIVFSQSMVEEWESFWNQTYISINVTDGFTTETTTRVLIRDKYIDTDTGYYVLKLDDKINVGTLPTFTSVDILSRNMMSQISSDLQELNNIHLKSRLKEYGLNSYTTLENEIKGKFYTDSYAKILLSDSDIKNNITGIVYYDYKNELSLNVIQVEEDIEIGIVNTSPDSDPFVPQLVLTLSDKHKLKSGDQIFVEFTGNNPDTSAVLNPQYNGVCVVYYILDDYNIVLKKDFGTPTTSIDTGNIKYTIYDPQFNYEPIDLFDVGIDKTWKQSILIKPENHIIEQKTHKLSNLDFGRYRFTLVDGLSLPDLVAKYSWILEADIEDAVIGLDTNSNLVWYKGIWNCGRWFGGTWYSGTWKDGTWFGGTWNSVQVTTNILSAKYSLITSSTEFSKWLGGKWMDGTWNNGTWYGGKWYGGTWVTGIWNNGTWNDGLWLDGLFRGGTWVTGIWKDGDFSSDYDIANWIDGVWNGGDFANGNWYNGKFDKIKANMSRFGTRATNWRKAIWYAGEWSSGEFHSHLTLDNNGNPIEADNNRNSIWYTGLWNDGTWYGGIAYNMDFRSGTWHNGVLNDIVVKNYYPNLNKIQLEGEFRFNRLSNIYIIDNFSSTTWSAIGSDSEPKRYIVSDVVIDNGFTDVYVYETLTSSGVYTTSSNYTGLHCVSNITNCQWYNGVWYNGIFDDGYYNSGQWYNGVFKKGTWLQ